MNSGFNHGYQWLIPDLMNNIAGWWCNNHPEKYKSQWEGLSHMENKTMFWNHQPDRGFIRCCIYSFIAGDVRWPLGKTMPKKIHAPNSWNLQAGVKEKS